MSGLKIQTEDDVRYWLETVCPHWHAGSESKRAKKFLCSRCVAKAVYGVLSNKAVEPVALSLPEPQS